jgi:hypothetical protein
VTSKQAWGRTAQRLGKNPHHRRFSRLPGLRVVSREISEEFGGRLVVEAAQAGVVVIGDEDVEVSIAFGMIEKAAVVGGAVLRHPVEMLAEAAVEAFDHAPRLREGRLLVCGRKGRVRRWVMACLAQSRSKGCWPEGLSGGLPFFVDGKAVGEFGAVVGEHGMDLEREAGAEAVEKAGRGFGPAIGQDFEIDKAGGAVDRDPGFPPGQAPA